MLILDEVMTGFGRTGKLFGYQHWNIKADIIALSKGMAAGYFPLGAVMTRDRIVEEVVAAAVFLTASPMRAIRSPAPWAWRY